MEPVANISKEVALADEIVRLCQELPDEPGENDLEKLDRIAVEASMLAELVQAQHESRNPGGLDPYKSTPAS
jgi:hypothetical protein